MSNTERPTFTLTVCSDDHIALNAFSRAFAEMAGNSQNLTAALKSELDLSSIAAMPADELTNLRSAVNDAYDNYVTRQMLKRVTVSNVAEPVTEEDDDTPSAEHADIPGTDSDGLPWDARIHAGSKKLNADGTWKKRKKPSDLNDDEWTAQVEAVRAELKSLMAVPVPPPVAAPEVPVAAPEVPEIPVEGAGIPPVAPPPVSDAPTTFVELMGKMSQKYAGRVEPKEFDVIAQEIGIDRMQQLLQRQDLIPTFWNAVVAKYGA